MRKIAIIEKKKSFGPISTKDVNENTKIKRLAARCLRNKWGTGKIVSISKWYTFCEEYIDEVIGEKVIRLKDIDEACAFCRDALATCKRFEFGPERMCENCYVPEALCSMQGSDGLVGAIKSLDPAVNSDRIIRLVELVRKCLRELSESGKLSERTEKLVENIVYGD